MVNNFPSPRLLSCRVETTVHPIHIEIKLASADGKKFLARGAWIWHRGNGKREPKNKNFSKKNRAKSETEKRATKLGNFMLIYF